MHHYPSSKQYQRRIIPYRVEQLLKVCEEIWGTVAGRDFQRDWISGVMKAPD
jgi:hypothetical protein